MVYPVIFLVTVAYRISIRAISSSRSLLIYGVVGRLTWAKVAGEGVLEVSGPGMKLTKSRLIGMEHLEVRWASGVIVVAAVPATYPCGVSGVPMTHIEFIGILY